MFHVALSREKLSPKLMIDAATLTGTCISSLSNRYIGVFTNRDAKIPLVIKSFFIIIKKNFVILEYFFF